MTALWSTVSRILKKDWEEAPEFGRRCAICVFFTQILFAIGMLWPR